MNKYLSLIFITFALIIAFGAYASDLATNEWGPVTNNVQMSIQLKNGQIEITNGQPCILLIQFKNLSSTEPLEIFQMVWHEGDGSYSFGVIDPFGKNISPISNGIVEGSMISIEVPPGETRSTDFNLGAICKLGKNGNYKVIAQKFIWFNGQRKLVQVVSNPLTVTVVPSQ
jgi:hypothetical protein